MRYTNVQRAAWFRAGWSRAAKNACKADRRSWRAIKRHTKEARKEKTT